MHYAIGNLFLVIFALHIYPKSVIRKNFLSFSHDRFGFIKLRNNEMMETIYVTKTKIWVFYLVVSCFFRKFASKNKFMKVPKKILNFVSENLGSAYSVSFIGEKDGALCFSAYIKNEKTGFPVALVLYSNGKITKRGGFLALDVIASFEKN